MLRRIDPTCLAAEMRPILWACVTLLVVVVPAAFPPEAQTARHPEYARKTFLIGGAPAGEVVSFLGLRLDRPARLVLELPEDMELFSHPQLEYRETRADRKSTLLRNSIAWNPAQGELTVGEHWFDLRTGVPQGNGPAFIASSPEFDETDLRQVKGWEPVLRQLRPLAVRQDAWGEARIKEFVVAADVRLRLELHRMSGGKLRLRMAAGPWVGRQPARGGPL